MTTRGLGVEESKAVADWIADAIENRDNADALAIIKGHITDLCGKHPVYPESLLA